jgi:cytochrome b561
MATLEGQTSFGPFAKGLHWIAALCVVLAWAVGSMGDEVSRASEATALAIHMSLGLAVLLILALRLAARFASPTPSELSRFSPWSNYLAAIGHWLLYALMAAVPVVGIMLQFARGEALPAFGLLHIASPWPAERAFAHSLKEVHEVLANALVILAALHIAAALFHHFVLRDRTLLRMLPQRRPSQ